MTRTYQRIPTATGDCLQAAFSSLLEIPLHAVPRFRTFPGEPNWQDVMTSWLYFIGRYREVFRPEELEEIDRRSIPSRFIAVGPGPGGEGRHAVLWSWNGLEHDPHPAGLGLPHGPEEFWIILRC